MVPYLDKSGIFLLAFPACECEWAHIMTTHISKCTLVCMSPWHSITGSHTCVSCTSPLSPGLHSAVYWLWPLQLPALGPIHDLVPSGAGAVWDTENASLPFFTVLQESRGGLLLPWGEAFFQILPLCLPLPKTTRTKRPGLGEVTMASTPLCSASLLFDGQGFGQGMFLLSLTFCAFRMSSLYLRRLQSPTDKGVEAHPLHQSPESG